jgi:hypothetical protein
VQWCNDDKDCLHKRKCQVQQSSLTAMETTDEQNMENFISESLIWEQSEDIKR